MERDNNRGVRVGLIKAVPKKWNLEHNWRLFETLGGRAVREGARMVCTPECFLDGYVAPDTEHVTAERLGEVAQSPGGPYLEKACEFASAGRVYVVFGFTEAAGSGCYNAAALISDTGNIIGVYRKTHLLDHDEVYLPGGDLPVFDTPIGRIGIMICADRRWPETARTLKIRGAELIMNPTYGMHHLDNEWWMRTRSYENELFICFAHPEVSLVTGPDGELAAKLDSNVPDVLVHDVDLARVGDTMFSKRRGDIYEG